MADYWTPPTWKLDGKLRTTFDSLRRSLNDNFDSALSSITTLLTFKATTEGVWTPYTPGTASHGISLGNGVIAGAYKQVGKTVHFHWQLSIGSTTTLGVSATYVNLPVVAVGGVYQVLPVYILDTGVRHYVGAARIDPSTANAVLVHTESGSTGAVTNTAGSPIGVSAGDTIVCGGTYEAA